MRTYSPSPVVPVPELPISQLGWGSYSRPRVSRRMRYTQTVRAPKTPLRELGWHALGFDAAAAVQSGLSIITSLLGGIWQAHLVRLKNATAENTFLPELVSAFDAAVKVVFDQANQGTISPDVALQGLASIRQNYWGYVSSFVQSTKGKGTAVSPCTTTQFDPPPPNADDPGKTGKHDPDASKYVGPWGTHCGGSSCTATCCVGCNNIEVALANCEYVFVNGGGTAKIPAIGAEMKKYGSWQGRSEYSLTYTPVSPDVLTSIENSLTGSGTSGSIAGIPMWALLAGAVALAVL